MSVNMLMLFSIFFHLAVQAFYRTTPRHVRVAFELYSSMPNLVLFVQHCL